MLLNLFFNLGKMAPILKVGLVFVEAENLFDFFKFPAEKISKQRVIISSAP